MTCLMVELCYWSMQCLLNPEPEGCHHVHVEGMPSLVAMGSLSTAKVACVSAVCAFPIDSLVSYSVITYRKKLWKSLPCLAI